jgi:hypothetical protein
MRRPIRGTSVHVGGAGASQKREPSFSQAKKLGLSEVTVDKKEFFKEVKIKNPQRKT